MHDVLCVFCSYSLSLGATISNAVHLDMVLSVDCVQGTLCHWSQKRSQYNSFPEKIQLILWFFPLSGNRLDLLLFPKLPGVMLYLNHCQFKFEAGRQGKRQGGGWKDGHECTDGGCINLITEEAWQIMLNRSLLLLYTISPVDFKDALCNCLRSYS